MSTIEDQWPDFCPDPDVILAINGGSLTMTSGSVGNVGEFDIEAPDLTCSLWKNGARQAVFGIDAQSGALSWGGSVPVAQNDRIELRFRFISPLSVPWLTSLVWERTLIFEAPAGNTTLHFGPNHVSMPVPDLEIAFGWESTNNKLRIGVKPTSPDGATQALKVTTRLPGGAQSSNTNVNLSSATQQTHDSAFNKGQTYLCDSEAELLLLSATTGARQEDRVTLVFEAADNIPAWSASTVRLYQDKVGGAGKLYR